jgi:hypothetical protein
MHYVPKAARCLYNACNNRLGSKTTACMVQVRYESRRRLAETRPRVRGQFVKAGTAASQSIAAQVRSIQPTLLHGIHTPPYKKSTSLLKLAAML